MSIKLPPLPETLCIKIENLMKERFENSPSQEGYDEILNAYSILNGIKHRPEKIFDREFVSDNIYLQCIAHYLDQLVSLSYNPKKYVEDVVWELSSVRSVMDSNVLLYGYKYNSLHVQQLLVALLQDKKKIQSINDSLQSLCIKKEILTILDISCDVVLNAGLCEVFAAHRGGYKGVTFTELDQQIAGRLMRLYCNKNKLNNCFPVSISGNGSADWGNHFLKWGSDAYGEARWSFVADFLKFVIKVRKEYV